MFPFNKYITKVYIDNEIPNFTIYFLDKIWRRKQPGLATCTAYRNWKILMKAIQLIDKI